VVFVWRCRLLWDCSNVKIRCHLMLTVDNFRPAKADLCMPVWGYVTTLQFKYVITMSYYLGCCIFFLFIDSLRRAKAPWSYAITLRYTTFGRILDEWSARRRGLFLDDRTPNKRDIHALGGIWTRNPSKRAIIDTFLWLRGHWDRSLRIIWVNIT
jgi:hypothetical protein